MAKLIALASLLLCAMSARAMDYVRGPVTQSQVAAGIAAGSIDTTKLVSGIYLPGGGGSSGPFTMTNVVLTSTRVTLGGSVTLGIGGTPSTNQLLDLEGGSPGIYLNNASNQTGYDQLFFSDINGNDVTTGKGAEIYYQGMAQGASGRANSLILANFSSTGNVILQQGGIDRVIVSSNGTVGVGTSGPQTTVDVNGNAQFGSGVTKSTFSTIGSLSLAEGSTFAVGSSTGFSVSAKAHLETYQVQSGSVTCNVGSASIVEGPITDNVGKFTGGTGSDNCTITFATAWTKTPSCFCNDESSIQLMRANSSAATSLTCLCNTGSCMSGHQISYFCFGHK